MDRKSLGEPSGGSQPASASVAYLRLVVAVGVSGVVMYGLMYLNTYSAADVMFSQTRLWMTVIMCAGMAIVMLLCMRTMYRSRTLNATVGALSASALLASLLLVRSQWTVDDVSYMKAMIPHHSIAVLTSSRARIRDPRVRRLADGILEAQVREIREMNALIADLQAHPVAQDAQVIPAISVE